MLRTEWCANTKVCKFNVGTELRQVFGAALRDVLAGDKYLFDRIRFILKPALLERAKTVLKALVLMAYEPA